MTSIMDNVEVCIWCDGTGRTEQTYTIGCGGGHYRSLGPCEICGTGQPYKGVGYVYRDTCTPVPTSVVAQIENTVKKDEAT